ncbi:hexose transport-related protein [Filobasidium floriforme]|uniref:hexose transport-related protein n=1 Tax=Filobasidium floriforme TaxID=5210 RepID=UPI001E8DC864|nr:hexose transport-related protein [Filobasidium floriforme]KAH8077366.1 hexose transport-related protein [Filobasidium floriforme]
MTSTDSTKSQHASDRQDIRSIEDFGLVRHPDTQGYVDDSEALSRAFGGTGLGDIFANRFIVTCVLAACTGGLLKFVTYRPGFDQGILSVVYVMPRFLDQFPEVNDSVSTAASFNKGLMTGMLEMGAFLGALMAGFVADKYSRKASILFGLIWFVLGSTVQTASFNYATLVAGRTLGGVGIGILSSTAPMYISEASEVAPPNVRGALLAMEQFTIVLGIIVMFYITYATRHIASDWCYRLPFLLQMVPSIFLGGSLYFLPYSPRWLASKGREEECLDALCKLRQLPSSDPRIQAEWILIRGEAIHNREALLIRHPNMRGEGFKMELQREIASWVDMFRPEVIRRTHIGIGLMFFQQFVGINALIYYSPSLFETLGLDYELRLTLSGVMNVVQIAGVIPAIFLLDKLGRKFWLYFGSFGMMSSHFIVAAMVARYSANWADHPAQAWVGVAFILFYIWCFGTPVPWSMPAEVHASSYRAKGVALATCSNWINNFIIGLVTPPMIRNIGYGTFLFFGSFSFLSAVWTYFFIPETKGKTLEQMDAAFKTDQSAKDAVAKAEISQLLCPAGSGSSDDPARVDEKRYDKGGFEQEWQETVI